MGSVSLWVAGWLLVVVLTPVIAWLSEGQVQAWIITLGVLIQASAVTGILLQQWSTRRLLRMLVPMLVFTWSMEWLGSTTGFPFGGYAYTSVLQPQLGGVPLIIPLAWWMMLAAAWGIAGRLVSPSRRVLFAMLSGLAFTSWDLYLDPQMVAFGIWRWDLPGGYFGIPVVNFLGWWLVSTLITWVLHPDDLPVRPLGVIFSLIWILDAVGLGLFWGQPGPALTGFVGMGLWVVLFWRKEGLK
jgi:uncharacterized membrane protein